jgi:transcription elongation factor GreA
MNGVSSMTQKIHITAEGLAKLEEELKKLTTVKRSEVADKIKRAREMGGTENNAEYEDAKNDQSFIEGRIQEIESQIRNAVVIEEKHTSKVSLGSMVMIRDQGGKIQQYTIVGRAEANPVEGRISNESPVGKALLGKKVKQVVEVTTPAGLLKLEILQVS